MYTRKAREAFEAYAEKENKRLWIITYIGVGLVIAYNFIAWMISDA